MGSCHCASLISPAQYRHQRRAIVAKYVQGCSMRVRPAEPTEAAAIARVHDACWRATYQGMMPDEVVAGSAFGDREAMWGRILGAPPERRCAYLAEDAAGMIVGCAWGGREASRDPLYQGELYGLYLLEAYQRRGLGRRLIGAVAANLHAQGYPTLLLWALTANHRARRFYEALGGALLREQETSIGGVLVPEVAYGWRDIRTLLLAGE
jgi:GNAT superfamily N-acetyltransferase